MPPPGSGRVFTGTRTVRNSDVTAAGRLRFDALARYLQDVAEDDLADTGWPDPCGWLLRRCVIRVLAFPRRGDRLRLATFCSGTGPRWARRTTTLAGPGGDLAQATALWVAIDRSTGQPVPPGPVFERLYGEAAGGRRVSARLSHPAPDPAARFTDWPLRASDFDTAGHVGNTVHWQAVEEVLAGLGWPPASAELEYHRPVLPGCRPRLGTVTGPDRAGLWLLDGPQLLASAQLIR
jgi:acyl-ACP thioesterase